ENVSTASSLSINPDLLVTRRYVLFDATARASSATDGTRLIQGGATFWGATPFARYVQVTGLLSALGTKAGRLGTTAAALDGAYKAALQANPKLTRGQFIAANMLAK